MEAKVFVNVEGRNDHWIVTLTAGKYHFITKHAETESEVNKWRDDLISTYSNFEMGYSPNTKRNT